MLMEDQNYNFMNCGNLDLIGSEFVAVTEMITDVDTSAGYYHAQTNDLNER